MESWCEKCKRNCDPFLILHYTCEKCKRHCNPFLIPRYTALYKYYAVRCRHCHHQFIITSSYKPYVGQFEEKHVRDGIYEFLEGGWTEPSHTSPSPQTEPVPSIVSPVVEEPTMRNLSDTDRHKFALQIINSGPTPTAKWSEIATLLADKLAKKKNIGLEPGFVIDSLKPGAIPMIGKNGLLSEIDRCDKFLEVCADVPVWVFRNVLKEAGVAALISSLQAMTTRK